MKEAYLYEKLADYTVSCFLCEHRCKIPDGKRGVCGVRQNSGGTLYSLVYGKVSALNIDPIEKKPLYHFQPGSQSLSLATIGCNLICRFCQNHDISQASREWLDQSSDKTVLPEDIVRIAEEANCASISFTYTEPTIFFEFAYDIAKLAKKKGIKNTFITNGFMTPEMLNMAKSVIDAANVDLKCFNDTTYQRVMGGRLQPVLESIKLMKELGIWIEITTLIVPSVNDTEEEIEEIAEFISEIDNEIPWHVSRFHPDYNFLDARPTEEEKILSAREIGIAAGLKYVYTGNIFFPEGNTTYCYACGEKLIERSGMRVTRNVIQKGKCPKCHAPIAGVELSKF